MTKRLFDIVVASCGLVLLLPVCAIIAAVVRIDSPGPVFFRQERVGRGFRRFRIFKFRTMRTDAPGGSLTMSDDIRITRSGWFLRRLKLDELPQLINVWKGEMSIVGPRPEVPEYVAMFEQEYAEILTVRPGITDFASLKYRDEAAYLARSANPVDDYVREILPDKLRLSREYVLRSSLTLDVVLVLRTIGMVGPEWSQWKLRRRQR